MIEKTSEIWMHSVILWRYKSYPKYQLWFLLESSVNWSEYNFPFAKDNVWYNWRIIKKKKKNTQLRTMWKETEIDDFGYYTNKTHKRVYNIYSTISVLANESCLLKSLQKSYLLKSGRFQRNHVGAAPIL